MNDVNDHGTNGIAAMMTLTNGNAAVIIDNWRRDHEFVIIASSIQIRSDEKQHATEYRINNATVA